MQEGLPVITKQMAQAIKPRDIQPNKRDVHLIEIEYCADTLPTNKQKRMRTT